MLITFGETGLRGPGEAGSRPHGQDTTHVFIFAQDAVRMWWQCVRADKIVKLREREGKRVDLGRSL